MVWMTTEQAGRMTKTTVPKGSSSIISRGDEGARRRGSRRTKRVQGTGTIAPDDFPLRPKILHRTTKRVKFDRTIIVNGKLAYRNKALNESWRHKHIREIKVAR